MAVGRLDEKSEGLLLLTSDGKFSNHITSSNIEKEYHVMVHGIITASAICELRHGVEITVNRQSYLTKPCVVKVLERTDHIIERFVRDPKHGKTSWLSITIREGKFRQVRKMSAKVGYPTLRLGRVRIGKYHLGKMTPGEIDVINY